MISFFSIPSQEIALCDLFCVEWGVKPQLCQSVNPIYNRDLSIHILLHQQQNTEAAGFAAAGALLLPDVDGYLQAAMLHLRVTSCESMYEAQHRLASI